MALIPEEFLNSVVIIGNKNKDGKIKWIGTGFVYAQFVKKLEDDRKNYVFFLVTNRHVIQKRQSIVVRFNSNNNAGSQDIDISLHNNGQPIWTGHSDSKIDVAVMKINMQLIQEQGLNPGFFRSDDHVMNSKTMKESGILEGDFVYALGYPMGIVNAERQYALVRSGIISRIRDIYDQRSKEYIIDAFVFPGNSGGPVLSKPEAIGIKGTRISKSSALIGIVKGYIPYKDVAISKQTNRPRIIFEENTGLTSVIPVDYIQETINLDLNRSKQ